MVDGKENFTTDDAKDTFPSLCFFAARLVYYINVNCMYNLQKTIINPFECKCDDYSGCRFPNDLRDYCDVCYLNNKHNPFDNEKVYRIKDLINKNIKLVNDFKKYNVDIETGDYTFATFNRQEMYSFWNSVF